MHSVEKQFGSKQSSSPRRPLELTTPSVSRIMVYLLSRTAKLLADLNDNGVVLSEKKPEAIALQADDENGSIDGDALISLDTLEQINNMSSGKTAELWNTAQTLLEDIERWLRLLNREKTEHERVHLGNLAYANMMKVSTKSMERFRRC